MVSLSSRRPLRESPRLLGVGVLLAICLLLVGLLIGTAISGSGPAHASGASGSSGAAVSQLRHTVAAQAASLRSERATVTSLQAKLTTVQRQAAHRSAALRRSRRAARCWRARARHPGEAKLAACLASK